MMQTVIRVGSSLEEATGEFTKVWRQVERGEDVQPRTVLGFATWEQLCGVLSKERLAVLQHLGGWASAAALAQGLGWKLEEVSHHLEVLVSSGLIEQHGELYRRIADDLTVRISLKS